MTFGAACSPTSAQFVKNVNADEFAHEFPVAAKAIRESHYVDDYVCSFSTDEEAIQVTKDVIEVHRRGGFTFCKFVSSSQKVLSALGNKDDRESVDMHLETSPTSKILGMRWRTDEDAFYFAIQFPKYDLESTNGDRPPTKRELLSATMSIYDPFGFLAEFMLPTKLILQELWRTGVGWDDPVPHNINCKWQQWRNTIASIESLRIPRCYSPNLLTSNNVELHVFSQSSWLFRQSLIGASFMTALARFRSLLARHVARH